LWGKAKQVFVKGEIICRRSGSNHSKGWTGQSKRGLLKKGGELHGPEVSRWGRGRLKVGHTGKNSSTRRGWANEKGVKQDVTVGSHEKNHGSCKGKKGL